MKKKVKASNYVKIEKLLFHGTTPDTRTLITGCEGKTEQCVYDEGSYFAVKASNSNNYSSQSGEKTRLMFLAFVLTGECRLGGHDLRRTPPFPPPPPSWKIQIILQVTCTIRALIKKKSQIFLSFTMTNGVIFHIWSSIVYNSFKYLLQTDQISLLNLNEQICNRFQNIRFSPNWPLHWNV